ncbi:DUF900 [Desulfonema limicola]|uniref:DUF900 n=1 Tax=Desulfonema limicola TaxID=45656 RepID=A0A975GJZ4_9BACT|nr:alpha/beta hydrolase [Desulfonema limicola]QTA83308.1 DUF900 [Desulfonema limicola]
MSYNLSELSKLLNAHSDRNDIELFLDELKIIIHDLKNKFSDYDDIQPGGTKLGKILSLLRTVDSYGKIKEAFYLYIEVIRTSDEELKDEVNRIFPPEKAPEDKTLSLPPDVLIISANPPDMAPLDLKKEADFIKESLEEGNPEKKINVLFEENVKASQIQTLLLKHDPLIFHFSVYGNEEGDLVFLGDDQGKKKSVKPEILAETLRIKNSKRLECIFLNACYSAASADAFSDVAKCVIGMKSRIDDESARKFAKGFYTALALERNYLEAFYCGRNAIQIESLPNDKVPDLIPNDKQFFDPDKFVSAISARRHRAVSEQDEETSEITLFYGTNRERVDENDHTKGYSSERSQETLYGTCKVIIPKRHKIGKIGSSWWRSLLKLRDARIKLESIEPKLPDDFWELVKSKIQDNDNKSKSALIYIHGYNVTFEDAAVRAAQISEDISFPGITAFYSWPSKGKPGSYIADGQTIEASEIHIENFFINFAQKSQAENIHLIVHSMGNRAVLRTMNNILGKLEGRVPFNQIFLAAPDVDLDFFEQKSEAYKKLSKQTTLYASPNDKILGISKFINQGNRAGFHPPIKTFPGIHTVRVEKIDMGCFGHGYYADSRIVIDDMFKAVTFGAAPEDRNLRPKKGDSGIYWEFKA